MQGTAARKNRSRAEQVRLLRAVEQLRTIDEYIKIATRLVSHLSGFYFDAWRDITAASDRVKHALFVLDDSGQSEYILEKCLGV